MGAVVFGTLGFLFAPQARARARRSRGAWRARPSPRRPAARPPAHTAPTAPPAARLAPTPRRAQISRALVGDVRLPRFVEEEGPKDPEATKQELIDKIAQVGAGGWRAGLGGLVRAAGLPPPARPRMRAAARPTPRPRPRRARAADAAPAPRPARPAVRRAQLNASIDEVASPLKPKGEAEVVTAELS